MATRQDKTLTLNVPFHDLKNLAHLMIGLLFSVANIGESE